MSAPATHTKVETNLKLTPSLSRSRSDVPAEIHGYIIELLAEMLSAQSMSEMKAGMKTISLVSKRFRAIALPYLFSDAVFNDATSERSSGLSQLLIDHPRVARRVRRVQYSIRDEDVDERVRSGLTANVDALKTLPLIKSIVFDDKRKVKKDVEDISSITWRPLLRSYIQSGSLTVIALCNLIDPPMIDILRTPHLTCLIMTKCLPKGQTWDLAQAKDIPSNSNVTMAVIHGQPPYDGTSTNGFPIFKFMEGATRIRHLIIAGKIDFTLSTSHALAAKWFEKLDMVDIQTNNGDPANEVPWQTLYGSPREDGLVMFPSVKTFNLAVERPPARTLRGLFPHMPSLENVKLTYPNRAFKFRLVNYIKPTTTPNLKNLVFEWHMPARSNWAHYSILVSDSDQTYTNIYGEDDDQSESSSLQPMINYAISNLLWLAASLDALETLKIVLHFEVLAIEPKCNEDEKAGNKKPRILDACEDIAAKLEEFILLMSQYLLLPSLRTVWVDIRMKIPRAAKNEQASLMKMLKSKLDYGDDTTRESFRLHVKAKVFWDNV